jgi:hypothetical protein
MRKIQILALAFVFMLGLTNIAQAAWPQINNQGSFKIGCCGCSAYQPYNLTILGPGDDMSKMGIEFQNGQSYDVIILGPRKFDH